MANPVSADQQLDLALRLLENDEEALAETLRTLGPPIFHVLRQRYDGVLQTEDIEDIISIAIHRLWEARRQYDDRKASLRTWFFRIAENAARDVFKYGWHKARQMECDLGEDFELDQFEHPDTAKRHEEEGKPKKGPSKEEKDMKQIIGKLPDVQRTIVMADAHARDHIACSNWLAEQLNIPVGTVRVYRKRAMDAIRAELRRRGYKLH